MSFQFRAQAGDIVDVAFVSFLIFLKSSDGEFPRIVIDQFVTLSTEQHQICYLVYVFRPVRAIAARSIRLKGHYVGHLRKVSLGERHVVFKKKFVAAVEFASPSRSDKKNQARERSNISSRNDGRSGGMFAWRLPHMFSFGWSSSSEAFFRTPRTTPATLNSVLITIGWWAGLLDWGFRTT